MIQHLKATYFDTDNIAEQILASKTALESKKLAMDILNYNHDGWNNIAKEMCESGIKAKFMQNEHLQSTLLKTGTRVLAESCLDQVWGTEVPSYDDQALNQHSWISQGILGKILEDIREELNAQLVSANGGNSTDIAASNSTNNTEMETTT